MKNKTNLLSDTQKQADAVSKELPPLQAVDENKRMEKKLQIEELRFRAFVEHSSDIIVLVSLNGVISYINPAVETVLGFKPEERIGADGFELVHPDDKKFLAEAFNTLAQDANSPVIQGEMRLRHKDGSWRTLEAAGSKLVNNTAVEAIIVNYRDITERKRIEEKLHREEQRFRALAEQSSDIIVLVDREGFVTYKNPAVESLLGFKHEEKIGINIFELVHPDDLKVAGDTFNNMISDVNAPNPQFEIRLRHKDGSWLTFELLGSKLVNDNIVETIIVNLRDITERKKIEEKLREEEQRFRAFAEQSSDIIVMIDRKGMITYENPAIKVLGINARDRIGASSFDNVHPDDVKTIKPEIYKLFKDINAPVFRSELRLRHSDGSWRKFEVVASGLSRQNIVESVIINLRDITERKKAEEALQESERRYRELSIIDDLTQLYNSRHFYDQLKKEIERSSRYGQPLTLLLLDLDKFKAFNDAYGHVEGDCVLARLGQVIKQCLRETDSAYRYGGEEFTIMLPMTTSKEAITTAKRIQTEFRKEAFSPLLSQKVYVTVSIGLAQYRPNEEMKAFVHRVDQIMYKAKKGGRDRICSES